MPERPILFSGSMVWAILDGRKTQTRRVVKPQPRNDADFAALDNSDPPQWWTWLGDPDESAEALDRITTKYAIGDRFWVRETWAQTNDYDGQYLLDGVKALYKATPTLEPGRWRPSIFMPRWASRIAVEVTDVRIERIREISDEDIDAMHEHCRDTNSWVWVIVLERVD